MRLILFIVIILSFSIESRGAFPVNYTNTAPNITSVKIAKKGLKSYSPYGREEGGAMSTVSCLLAAVCTTVVALGLFVPEIFPESTRVLIIIAAMILAGLAAAMGAEAIRNGYRNRGLAVAGLILGVLPICWAVYPVIYAVKTIAKGTEYGDY